MQTRGKVLKKRDINKRKQSERCVGKNVDSCQEVANNTSAHTYKTVVQEKRVKDPPSARNAKKRTGP